MVTYQDGVSSPGSRRPDGDYLQHKIVPVRHPLRWFGSAVVLLLLAMLGRGLVANDAFQWPVVGHYLFNSNVLRGVALSLILTVVCMAIGIILGTVLAVMRLSASRLLTSVAWAYTWVFRSIPQLVQLILWYNLGALYQKISLGIPFGQAFVSFNTNHLISPLTAAVIGLGLSQAGYTSEVVRSGIQSVDRGQHDAALALGMRKRQLFRRIIFPQAMRVIIPPIGNEVVSMLKNTSLVSVIALAELLYSVQLIYSRTYQTIPLLIVACIWYLALVSVLSVGQHFVEKRFSRGVGTHAEQP